jgi:hypothetical protein
MSELPYNLNLTQTQAKSVKNQSKTNPLFLIKKETIDSILFSLIFALIIIGLNILVFFCPGLVD